MDTALQIMSGCQEDFSPSASPEPIVYNPKKPIHSKKTILSHLRTLKANKYTAITLTTDNVQIRPLGLHITVLCFAFPFKALAVSS